MLRVEPVRRDNVALLIRYVCAHGSEHDESYLPRAGFTPSREHPSYVVLRDDQVVGAVSLMRTPRYLRVHRGRFAIFHALEPFPDAYPLLFDAIQRHFDGLRAVYLFLPEKRRQAAEAMLRLGFAIERYSYVMKLERVVLTGVAVPDGLVLRPIRREENDLFRRYAGTINANFAELAGHVPMQPDAFRDWMEEDTYLEDGYVLLLRGRRAVGTVGVTRDILDRNAGEVSALSVAKDLRHQGLGRLLLRHAVCFATWHGLRPVYLSLNAENNSALRLYESEGFVVTDTMVCYTSDCSLETPAAPR